MHDPKFPIPIPSPYLESLILNNPLSEWQKPDCTSALWDAQGFQLGGEGLLIQQRRRTGSEALRFLYFEIEGEKSEIRPYVFLQK